MRSRSTSTPDLSAGFNLFGKVGQAIVIEVIANRLRPDEYCKKSVATQAPYATYKVGNDSGTTRSIFGTRAVTRMTALQKIAISERIWSGIHASVSCCPRVAERRPLYGCRPIRARQRGSCSPLPPNRPPCAIVPVLKFSRHPAYMSSH